MTWHSTASFSGALKRLKGSRYIFISSIPSISGTTYSSLMSLSYARGIWVKILICQTSLTHTCRWERLSDPLRKATQTMTTTNLPVYMTTRGFILVLWLLCCVLSCDCKALWILGFTWCHVFQGCSSMATGVAMSRFQSKDQREGSFPYGFSKIFIPQDRGTKKRLNKARAPTFKWGGRGRGAERWLIPG